MLTLPSPFGPGCRGESKSHRLRIKNIAADSRFSSIARCSNVWRHPSGPVEFQQSVSTPCRIKTDAISSCSDSSAVQRGASPKRKTHILLVTNRVKNYEHSLFYQIF